jgi:23S rRNA pseudouridine1911/1915/1917 synthase
MMTPVPGSVDYSATPPAPLDPSSPAPLRPASDPLRPLAIEVPPELAGLRLDQALARLLPDHSRSRLQDWIRRERVRVDGASAQPRQKVWGGERIDVHPDSGIAGADLPQALPLTVVFEDDAILVLDKPAGMVVHPGNGNRDGTLLNALLHHAPALANVPRAGIVHRLDKDTSGLLVVAKTLAAQTNLVRQLQARSVRRDYLAVVLGVPSSAGKVEAPVGRHPVQRTRMAVVATGKPALTHYRVLCAGTGWSLLECSLETGRTHQIRVHLASIGHPVLGDPTYLGRAGARAVPAPALTFRRQALHAARLALTHPLSAERMTWECAPPADFATLLSALQQHAAAG